MPRIRKLTLILAVCAGIALVACGAPASDRADAQHSATVQALLPTAAATQPAAAQPAAPTQPSQPATPTNTAVPATDPPPPPTYTPRPLPTYTPRPAPAPAGGGERSEGIPFQAQTLDGSVFNLADTYGTPTLLVFWAPW